MIEVGRVRPGGDAANLRWVQAPAEACPLRAPYALVVAGASFHWFDWPITLSRLAPAMAQRAVLAIVGYELCPVAWGPRSNTGSAAIRAVPTSARSST
jgi:hypothetical protein